MGAHYRAQLQLSGDACSVWAPTLPGYGRSEKQALQYSQELWSDFLYCFARDVVKAPVVAVGNSIGGFMCASLAGDQPELVEGLVLLNSAGPIAVQVPPNAAPPKPLPLLVNGLTLLLLSYLRGAVPSFLRRCYPVAPHRADEWLIGEIQRGGADSGSDAVFASVFYLPRPRPLDALIASFGKPVLVLNGALDPLDNNAGKRGLQLQELCSNVRTVLLQAGHCVHDEVPEVVNAELRSFLASLTRGGAGGAAAGPLAEPLQAPSRAASRRPAAPLRSVVASALRRSTRCASMLEDSENPQNVPDPEVMPSLSHSLLDAVTLQLAAAQANNTPRQSHGVHVLYAFCLDAGGMEMSRYFGFAKDLYHLDAFLMVAARYPELFGSEAFTVDSCAESPDGTARAEATVQHRMGTARFLFSMERHPRKGWMTKALTRVGGS
jgi:pimeloyl-ACP methyl ester carboxylesterase